MEIRDTYTKYCNGDKIPNAELLQAVKGFAAARDALIKLGPAFTITFKECNYMHIRLSEMVIARGL